MKICIRADGGSQMGMGHVMRMTALAKELRKNHDIFFACRIDNPISGKYYPGISFIKDNNFKVVEIDEKNLKNDIKKIYADCIITDSYDVDEEYFDIVKKHFKISGYVDDENICEFFNVDFIINQNLYAESFNYKTNKDTKMILGSSFVILRDEFRKNIKDKEIRDDIKDIMITVGGSDNNNLTEKIIKQLSDLEYTLHVVIGGGFNNIEKLKLYECEKVRLYFNAHMKSLMEMCDVCIAGCGTTVYELAVCKTPFVGISVAENQDMMLEFIKNNKISRTAKIDEIKEQIESFNYEERSKVSENLGKLVDGQGIFRISQEINEILK